MGEATSYKHISQQACSNSHTPPIAVLSTRPTGDRARSHATTTQTTTQRCVCVCACACVCVSACLYVRMLLRVLSNRSTVPCRIMNRILRCFACLTCGLPALCAAHSHTSFSFLILSTQGLEALAHIRSAPSALPSMSDKNANGEYN